MPRSTVIALSTPLTDASQLQVICRRPETRGIKVSSIPEGLYSQATPGLGRQTLARGISPPAESGLLAESAVNIYR